jgi:hypothetical protein
MPCSRDESIQPGRVAKVLGQEKLIEAYHEETTINGLKASRCAQRQWFKQQVGIPNLHTLSPRAMATDAGLQGPPLAF